MNNIFSICDRTMTAGLHDALSIAKEVYSDKNTLQKRIDETYNKLSNAFGTLVTKQEVDKTTLAYVLEKTQIAIEKQGIYHHNEAWSTFTTAYANAQNVYSDKNVSQEAVNIAAMDVSDAYASIRLLPDEKQLAQLKDFVKEISAVPFNLYSATHQALFHERKAEAQAMHTSKDFSEEAYKDFELKMVEVLQIIANEKRTTSNKQDSSEDLKTHPSVATGDPTNTLRILMLSMLSFSGLYWIQRRKKATKQ